jgi:hypothetical protein
MLAHLRLDGIGGRYFVTVDRRRQKTYLLAASKTIKSFRCDYNVLARGFSGVRWYYKAFCLRCQHICRAREKKKRCTVGQTRKSLRFDEGVCEVEGGQKRAEAAKIDKHDLRQESTMVRQILLLYLWGII